VTGTRPGGRIERYFNYSPISPCMSDQKTEQTVSMVMLLMIVAISVIILSLIFLFIILYSGLDTVGMALGIGAVSVIFSIVVYFAHMVYDDTVTLALSGAFIMTGLLAFYAAILLSTAIPGDKIIYIVVLSIFVLMFLIFAYRLRRYGERQKERIAKRKHLGKDE